MSSGIVTDYIVVRTNSVIKGVRGIPLFLKNNSTYEY